MKSDKPRVVTVVVDLGFDLDDHLNLWSQTFAKPPWSKSSL